MATAEQIKQLREATGAGVLEAKKVLDEHNGDMQKAMDILKARGIAKADKKAERHAKDGLVECYIHSGGKLGVMVEVNCETDFVARTDAFKQLAHDIALQIAATNPKYVTVEEIPQGEAEVQRKTFEDATRAEGKPEAIIAKIVQGKLDKYYGETVLYRQPFIRDDGVTIGDLVKSVIAKTGENIVVKRFARFGLGE
ncbi:MAG: translation elongation factor Ts [Anaerolineae bacterium]